MARLKLTPEQAKRAAQVRASLKKQGIKRQLPAMSSRARQAKQKEERAAFEAKSKV
jgi:hypothetical protein